MKLVSLLLIVFSCIAIAEDPPRAAARLAHGLSWDTPAPGRNEGRIYYYVPPQLDMNKPAGLFIFLHGGSSSSKETAPQSYISGGLKRALDNSDFILAMPSAPPPQKIHTGHRWNYEGTYKSILATIDDVARRAHIDRDRIIFGGVSMGGYGAILNGLRYPETFGHIVGVSNALVTRDVNRRADTGSDGFSRGWFESIFGDLDKVQGGSHDPWAEAEKLRHSGRPLPGIYQAVGTEDFLYPVNQDFRAHMEKLAWPNYTYEEGPGGHVPEFTLPHLTRGLELACG